MDINEALTTDALQCVDLKAYYFAYQLLSQSFFRQWQLKTLLADAEGRDLFGDSRFGDEMRYDRRESIALSVARGGCACRQSVSRPAISVYSVPLMFNSRLLGGIVVEYDSDIDPRLVSPAAMEEAMWSLKDLVCGMGLANEALLENADGLTGVYVLSGKRVVFKPIQILYHADNHVIAREAVYYKDNGEVDTEKTPSLPQLEAYDRVIVKGKNLYDGKVINNAS